MLGWTAVTGGGATSAPALLVDRNVPGLMVRGSDGNTYIADISLEQPTAVDSTAWSNVPIVGDGVICRSRGWTNVCSDRGRPANRVFGISHTTDGAAAAIPNSWIMSSVDDLPAGAGTGYANYLTDDGVPYVYFVKWDGGQGLSVLLKQAMSSPKWQKLTFGAYADPSCASTGKRSASCLFVDGGGNRLNLFRWNDSANKFEQAGALPDVPGGGGMRKGESELIRVGSVLMAFARSKDGTLYAAIQTPAGAFGPWKSWGGKIAEGSAPSCVEWKGRPGCAIRGTDNRIYVKWISTPAGGL